MKRLVAGSRSTVATMSARKISPSDGLFVERVAIGLADQVAGDVGIAEPLADAVDDRGFQRVVVQDVLVDEGGELRLAARDVLRLAADARPDRIDLVEGLCRPCLKLGHGLVLRRLSDP